MHDEYSTRLSTVNLFVWTTVSIKSPSYLSDAHNVVHDISV